jgi:Cu/Ag efflux pump CusA
MALFGIPLGPDKAMISAIALGIGIDYSIHLMSCFRDEVVAGATIYEAIVESMRTTGRAILFNALVVVAGFLVLAFSQSPSNATFGAMIAANMAIACVAALTLLPAALTILGYVQTSRALHTPVRIGGKLLSPQIAMELGLADPVQLGSKRTSLETTLARGSVETRSLPG